MISTQPEKQNRGPRNNQKLKILYLAKILLENTDVNHDMTLQEIIDQLAAYDVTAERKSLYDDIAQLDAFGIQIKKTQYGKTYHYQVSNRDFELAELKLLVDSVASAKFITEEKSNQLIKKIEHLASKQEASMLQRQVYVSGRVKSMNKDIMENVDAIHNAIAQNVEILCENGLAGVMIDRFGKDVPMLKVDEEHFKVVTKVAASSHFIHWVMALGSGAKITAPENLVKEVKEEIQRLSAQYTK